MTRASGGGSLIAVVGMSCRLPRAPDLDAYWKLLAGGEHAISEIPAERWELIGRSAEECLSEGDGAARLGAYLEQVDGFDAEFFGISPREAEAIDPQQRLALELSWEALEDARIAPASMRDSRAGVFVGAIANDYESLARRRGAAAIGPYTELGIERGLIANRVSYTLGLGGPSLTVDTGQSSSLAAVHLACESLRRGEASFALAGGVHLNLDPLAAIGGARLGVLSPGGRCFAFDARANGFVRGEGGGLVALKPLEAALADGDRVRCVIRGSALNNDGGGRSLTTPSRVAQEKMLSRAYQRAGLARAAVQYVELHGSGTPVGDPIEAAALGNVLGRGRDPGDPLAVGSAKTNVGHLEGAAGIAGLIKTALAVERGHLPASLNFERPNPKIPLEELRLRVQDSPGEWPHPERTLIGGVSSFGVGGTNCHVVVEEAPPSPSRPLAPEPAPVLGAVSPFVLSAKTEPALREQASRLAAHLEEHPQLDPPDVAHTLATAREAFGQRVAILGSDRAELLAGLAAAAEGVPAPGLVGGRAIEGGTVLLFPGYGSQWEGMAAGLLDCSPLFKREIGACEEALEPHVEWSLEEVLRGGGNAPSVNRTDVGQLALFAMMVALAALWRALGVKPTALVGHSLGEIAAAHVAGGLSLEDAVLVAVLRNKALRTIEGQGAMASVALPAAELEERLGRWGERLGIAALNGPASAVVSGDPDSLEDFLAACGEEGVRARKVRGAVAASHSPQVEALREELLTGLASIDPRSGELPFYSTVSGEELDTAALDAEYWYCNLRQTVRLEPAVRALLERGERHLIEVSPHPVLGVPLEETIEAVGEAAAGASVLTTLKRDEGGPQRFLRSAAEAHVAGVGIDWRQLFADGGAELVDLPTYPFQRQSHWLGDLGDLTDLSLLRDRSRDLSEPAHEASEQFAAMLAELPEAQQAPRVLALVCDEASAILGLGDAGVVDPERSFKELGFDSPAAMELRKRLVVATGLRLGSTVVFDHPSPADLTDHLLARVTGTAGTDVVAVGSPAPDEPIAIVGMACRYPGGASSPERLWRLLAEGVDAIGEFPSDRGWDLERLYDPDPDRDGTSYVRAGGFIEDAGCFDAGFFGIAPREALAMDPQQRLLLEASWEALEGAGLDPGAQRGSPTGVFAGVAKGDYDAGIDGYRMTGGLASVASGRISYTLGLEGPAITVDTACSSSLVAMHLAAASLRAGECSFALAGGATVLATPTVFIDFSRQRALSPDGRCKSFAESADGTGWAEGVGMLVLERLSDAQRNGHPVLATIRGSAVNQDGASNGLTAPNGPSQERVIRQALANAGLSPADIDMVEAHGTATTLGDPIEAGALLATYGQDRDKPLKLGSIKSNIGHTLAAAGVAGVIKAVMALREGLMPRTLHVDAPSSKVDWEAGEIELLTEAEPWESNGSPRRAAVSSFGISGTNAHLILEEAPGPVSAARGGAGPPGAAPGASTKALSPAGPAPLLLSAKTEPALGEAARRLGAHMRANPDLDPTDLAFSLATTRAAFEHRAVLLAGAREELLGGLEEIAGGRQPSAGALAQAHRSTRRPVFLFGGQGSQWQGMGVELIASSPSFARSIEECEAALAPHVEWSLGEILAEESGSWLERLDIVQPALFALMVSLAALWREHGVEPAAVAGHSQGEIAAAHVAGILSLEDAARVVALRAKAMARIAGKGGMLSVSLPADQLAERIEDYQGAVSLAAVNGPASLVASGETAALAELGERLEAEGVRTKAVAVDYAAHSAQVDALKEELLEAFEPVSPQDGTTPLHSTVTGERIEGAALGPEHWYRNLREPVLFEPALRSLLEGGHRAFLEISPHPVLAFGAEETFAATLAESDPALILDTLRRREGGPQRFATALAAAHVQGVEVDWEAFFATSGARRVPLPTYPFQRKRYWLEPGFSSAGPREAGVEDPEHPLLGAVIEDPSGGLILSGRLSLQAHPWLGEHQVEGTSILPATAFLELALAAARETGAQQVAELSLKAPLILPDHGALQLRVSVSAPDQEGMREIEVHSRPEPAAGEERGEWSAHAEGTLSSDPGPESEPLAEWPPPGAEPLDVSTLYQRLAETGFEYGPAFQGLTAAWRQGEEVCAEISLEPEQAIQAERFCLHPALLDAALHGIGLSARAESQRGLSLPFAWNQVSLHAAGAESLRVILTPRGEKDVSLTIADGKGAPLARVGGLSLRPLDPTQLVALGREEGLLGIEWQQLSLGEREEEEVEIFELHAETEPDPVAAARELAAVALERAQTFLAEEGEGRLAFLTRGAVTVKENEVPDPTLAAARGLLRSAQSEHPGRFLLVDTDGSEESRGILALALAAGEEEPQLALREGAVWVPRLAVAAPAVEAEAERPAFDPERTVLITGGLGGLGALVARHLVQDHGARHLLLASRSGPGAEGAGDLKAVLEELGARVSIVACDVSDREQLEALLASISAEHPLGAVIHAAGALDDATIESLGAGHLRRAFAPKAEAAWHLHELTADLDLSAFVLFSSVAATFGNPGQANYAAANAFLDALAQQRHAAGLTATSIAWGPWQREGSMTAHLAEADLARMRRSGVLPLSDSRGLSLFDQALAGERADVLALELDRGALRAQASAGALPALLHGLVRAPARRGAGRASSLAAQLTSTPEPERLPLVLGLVRSQVAAVLGYESAASIDPERAFKDLGFDSLAAVELRNRLQVATGLRLAATAVFDYPNLLALAEHLLGETSDAVHDRVAVAASRSEEPIAIVGMSCRYPGDASSPERLWQLLVAGTDAITGFPADRGWDLERLYDPDPERPHTSYAREGGFLAEAADFDGEFFGIGPREALAMDPQQRLLLEVSWEALERAGIAPTALRGDRTGVFTGVMHHDYGAGLGRRHQELEGYLGTGSSAAVASGRVSYTLGLEGPAITVDTACSSSLVATHLAAGSLRTGECSLALAGGATVLATPAVFIDFSRQRGLAPDGRCKAFAEAADGTGFSEGVGVLVLERLSDAERNGHEILATIRGSAVNQDGASNGLTAPNGPSQERVIRQALANAGLEPKDIDMVEAHGTGTTLGDPIEAGALLATYGQDRERPLKLGSIKSNIGHAQAAAGVGGVIKAVMAMREGLMPKTLHVDAPSSKVDWEMGEIELLAEAEPWESSGVPRRAAVSSFGASGTNAHLILEEAPGPVSATRGGAGAPGASPGASAKALPLAGPTPLVLSARSERALQAQAARLGTHLEDNPDLELSDVAFSLANSRTAFEHRAVVLGHQREELLEGLDALGRGERALGATVGRAAPSAALAYLFSGQGSQRAGMGKRLHEAHPTYASALEEACAELDAFLDRPLLDLLFASPGSEEAELLDHTTYAQPALFATEVALHRQLQEWGLGPRLLAGHSIGEIAAAHLAGVLSLPGASKLVAARGRLMGALPAGGAMVAVAVSEREVLEAIVTEEDRVSLAAVNGPASVVISGEQDAVEGLATGFSEEGRKVKRLAVSHAFHSPLMEPMLEEFEEVAASIEYSQPELPIVSGLSGRLLEPSEAMDPGYWVSQVRQPVRFSDALATLASEGATVFIELGPDAVLSAMAGELLVGQDAPEEELAFVSSMRRDRDEVETLTEAIAVAHAHGIDVDWEAFLAPAAPRRVSLPTYPFQPRRHWPSARTSGGDPGAAGQRDADHPLLGAVIDEPEGGGILFTGRLSLQAHPWLADHTVGGVAVVPATALLELALRAGEEVDARQVEELTLQEPLILPPGSGVALRVKVGPADERGRREISLHSRLEGEGAEWARNAVGTVSVASAVAAAPPGPWPPDGAKPLDLDRLDDRLAEAGLEYGPAFQGLLAAWQLGEETFAEVALPAELMAEAGHYAIHPALLDAALRALGFSSGSQAKLPFSWRGVSVQAPGPGELRVRLAPGGKDGVALDLSDPDGAPVARVELLSLRPVELAKLQAAAGGGAPLFELAWREIALDSGEVEEGAGVEIWRPEVGADGAGELAKQTLEMVQGWLADGEEGRLAVLTEGALSVSGEAPDPDLALVWGLVRSAQSEHPGRFALIDTDGVDSSVATLAAALSCEEPQLALRGGHALVPRVTRAADGEVGSPSFDPERTVLITGGTGSLGSLIARHLVEAHGVRHLLLASRSGGRAEMASALCEELSALGAEVRLAACDVGERREVESLLAGVAAEHPLGAVVHAAGIVDDGLVEGLGGEQLERVIAPKADGARHLHELTADLDLSAFVLFSSAAGMFGAPGQANYAAANSFLDALALSRRAGGTPATAIAWGIWERESAMTAELDAVTRARYARQGMVGLSDEQGLALFDAALASSTPLLLACRLDRGALREAAAAGSLPSLLTELAPVPTPRRGASSVAARLAAAGPAERKVLALQLVRSEVAMVLGHGSAAAVDPSRAFKEMGFDSLAAVELRNRLTAASGVLLAATAIFDYPNPERLASHLLGELGAGEGRAVEAELDRLQQTLDALPGEDPSRLKLATRLRALAADLEGNGVAETPAIDADQLESASDEELLEFIDTQVGGGDRNRG